jgi:type II secretory pathway pseudopilin PulG
MASSAGRREDGFTYLGLIIFVTIIGLVGAATLKVDSLLRRAAAEEELLDIGAAFSAALQSYAAATPQGQPTQPSTLNDLLKDRRFPGVRRHLRKIFVDPLTGRAEWGVVYAGDRAGVLAVYSLSEAKPLKIANFDIRFQNFGNKEHISDWKFTANGQGVVQKVAVTADGRRPDPAPKIGPVPDPPPPPPAPAEQAPAGNPQPAPEPPPGAPASEDPPAAPEEPASPPEAPSARPADSKAV